MSQNTGASQGRRFFCLEELQMNETEIKAKVRREVLIEGLAITAAVAVGAIVSWIFGL